MPLAQQSSPSSQQTAPLAVPESKLAGQKKLGGEKSSARARRATRARRRASAPPPLAAAAAGLRYVNEGEPGLTRVRRGRGFSYRDSEGRVVRDPATLRRVRSLAIPPAWRDVWICVTDDGHIQATGRDARGRKQYRYHPLWRSLRDEAKYERTIAFAEALPALRERVESDLARRGLPREKVIATVVRLLEATLLRVGNEEYARQNRSYGLTTLRDRHAHINGSAFRLSFKGKSGVRQQVGLRDRRLARIVRQCQDLRGQQLFQYLDEDGQPRGISSEDVNGYLREAMSQEFSAKDFRTWAGTVLAAQALRAIEEMPNRGEMPDRESKKALTHAVEDVARRLGNTPAVCRRCYIHPAVIDAYLDGSLVQVVHQRAEESLEGGDDLRAEERHVLQLLRDKLARDGQLHDVAAG